LDTGPAGDLPTGPVSNGTTANADLRAARKTMSRVESQIGKVDKRIATLHDQMAKAAADYGRLADLQRELDTATAEKNDLELAWLEAADLVG
jgi:ATP-binding cassette subfamily F protein uup